MNLESFSLLNTDEIPEDADALFTALKPAVPSAQRVGTVQPYAGSARIYLK